MEKISEELLCDRLVTVVSKNNNVGNMFKGKKQKYKNNLNAVVLNSSLFTVTNVKTSVMLFVECECLRWFMWFDSFMKDWIHHFFFLILPNKFLKHVIIVFVLTNLTWKRSRINFLYKKMTPKLVFLHSWKKSPSPWKKKKKLIKNISVLFVQIKSSEWCANSF